MSRASFDHDAFYEALDATRQAKKLTWKQVAEQAEVSASTLTRLGQGKRPDVDSLAALCTWAGLDADDYMRAEDGPKKPQAEVLAMISTYLRGDRNLSDESARLLESLVKATYEQLREDAPRSR